MDTEEIVIPEDAPGAAPAPGLGVPDIVGFMLKYGKAITTFVSGLISGSASFVVQYHGLKRYVTISDKPPTP